MPSSPANYRPVHMAFFVPDGNGGMRLDSAGSQANVNLQNLLLERDRPVPVPEHVEHVGRQKAVDTFLQKAGGETQYHRPRPGVAFPLPRVASPQRMHIDFHKRPQHVLDAARADQLHRLKGTIVGHDLEKVSYPKFDKTLQECHRRENHMISLKEAKQGMFDKLVNKEILFAQEDKDWIYEPLHVHVEGTNRALEKGNIPFRFVFRETWKTETAKEVDLWVIYANDTVAAAEGPNSWMGSRDIVDLQKYRS